MEFENKLHMVPEHMHDAIRLWITNGIPPGNFLWAVLTNDLREAVGRADELNQAALVNWVKFLYCHAPSGCWGSVAKVQAWHEAGGLNGKSEAA